MDFIDVDDLTRYINQSIVRVMDEKVNDEVREVIAEEIDYAYSEFQPNTYTRRYNSTGGFADPNMIETEEDLKPQGYSIEFTNEAIADGDDFGQRLDFIIENGIYNWKRKPPKRPVMARSIERLEKENVVEMSLRVGLKKYGVELK